MALPGAGGASGRYENPFASERVVAAVRIVGEIDHFVDEDLRASAREGCSISSIAKRVRIDTWATESERAIGVVGGFRRADLKRKVCASRFLCTEV